MRVLISILVCVLCGCASYGWADRDAPPQTVAVTTIDVDPHSGVDAALLTRELVEALGKRGVNAKWASGKSAIRCILDLREESGVQSAMTSLAQLDCTFADASVSRVGRSQATLPATIDSPSVVLVREQASLQAVQAIAAPLAAEVRDGKE